jgi:gamma-glutamyltranspeptidase/glutathione hydrolase
MYARQPEQRPADRSREAVVCSYNPEARTAALEILAAGGNAFDAFVAATFVEFVVAPGVTSVAGMLGALLYDAETGSSHHLDSEFDFVRDERGRWTGPESEPGKSAVVPGAVAGLAAIHSRFGHLSFRDVLQPAIQFAREGFVMTESYRSVIELRREVLERSEYGRATFFRDGQPISAGELLRQPELARLLTGLAEQGPAYMYTGPWATECVQSVRAQGGFMSREDLTAFQPRWYEPRRISYRGFEVQAGAGRSYIGAWLLLTLLVLENADPVALGHPSESADALETVLRAAQAVYAEPWLLDPAKVEDDGFVAAQLCTENAKRIWDRVQVGQGPIEAVERQGTHSYHIVVVDAQGNAVTGVNSIGSLPWGEGIFVQGAALTGSEAAAPWTGPGQRPLDPMSDRLVFRDGKLWIVGGTFAMSMAEASLQLTLNSIDYGASAEQSALLPRFGTYAVNQLDLSLPESAGLWLDQRFPEELVEAIQAHGFRFTRDGWIDTGLGSIVILRPDGTLDAGMCDADGSAVRPEWG